MLFYQDHASLPSSCYFTKFVQVYQVHVILPSSFKFTKFIQVYQVHVILPRSCKFTKFVLFYQDHASFPSSGKLTKFRPSFEAIYRYKYFSFTKFVLIYTQFPVISTTENINLMVLHSPPFIPSKKLLYLLFKSDSETTIYYIINDIIRYISLHYCHGTMKSSGNLCTMPWKLQYFYDM